MGSGVSRVICGAVSGTGSLQEVRVVGFRPRRVEVFNAHASGLTSGTWQETMADGYMRKMVPAGTTTYAADGITPLSDGFSIGADADLNADGETIHWTAFE